MIGLHTHHQTGNKNTFDLFGQGEEGKARDYIEFRLCMLHFYFSTCQHQHFFEGSKEGGMLLS
jgi:hypothetical protein